MLRSEKIEKILERRAGASRTLGEMDGTLAAVTTALSHLDDSRQDLLDRVDDDARQLLLDVGQAIRELREAVEQRRADIGRLRIRLSRPTLNVGMIGRARTGKSRFLQSLTGLDSRVIPDGKSGFCTGVPSVISNVPAAGTTADVHLHDERSFLAEVIGPYYRQFGLGSLPGSAREFAASPLPSLDSDDPAAQFAYANLKSYHDHFSAYGDLLMKPSPITDVGAEEIRSYVAQDDVTGTTEYHKFRAVRRVNIRTSFTASDVSGIGVIDLPGLGDTNLGDLETVLAALRDDVDVVVFVRKPAAHGDDVQDFDIALYTHAMKALPEIPMGQRSFLIINHQRSVDQDNIHNCRRFQARLVGTPIQVVSSTIVDCSEPGEVAAKFDPFVDYLLQNADELDTLLIAESLRVTAEVPQQLAALVKQAGVLAVQAQPERELSKEFRRLFTPAYDQFATALGELVEQLKPSKFRRDTADDDGSFDEAAFRKTAFEGAVVRVIGKARQDHGIPSVADIVSRISRVGAKLNAWGELLNELRAHLSRKFLDELDFALKDQVARMQEHVAHTLASEGALRPLSDRTGPDFLREVAERVQPLDVVAAGEPENEMGAALVR